MNEVQKAFTDKVEHVLRDIGVDVISFTDEFNILSWDITIDRFGHTWPLRLTTVGWNIDKLPLVYWRVPTPIWGWPHVSSEGEVCVSDHEGLEYDPDDVRGVIEWLLQEATKILAQYYGMPEEERAVIFADELEAYLRNDGSSSIILAEQIDVTKSLYIEVGLVRKAKNGPFITKLHNVNHGLTQLQGRHKERLGLLEVTIHQIQGLLSKVQTDWWNVFLSRLSPSQQDIVNDPKNRGIVLQVPNNFGESLVLIYWGCRSAKLRTSYFLQRQYHEYLIQRTGSQKVLRHVIIVGCGAVGSRVAELVTLAGINKITLIDNDRFSSDNLGRHILGRHSVSKLKVEELAILLKDRMPGIHIETRATDVQTLLLKNELTRADAIVLATGNSVLERSIIRLAYKNNWASLIVSTSVEAAGLGGHAIAMRPGTPGCLDCLYIDPQTQLPLSSMRTALIEPGQKVTRQITGCGGFTPYSALDATRTAHLAAERVLFNCSLYSRWAGDPMVAKDAGIQPSATHHALRTQRINPDVSPSEYAQPSCPCCSV